MHAWFERAVVVLLAGLLTGLALVAASDGWTDEESALPPRAAGAPAIQAVAVVRKGDAARVVESDPLAVRRVVPSGISATVAAMALPDEKVLLTPILGALRNLPSPPPARIQHFLWMNDFGAELICWRGEIQEYRVAPDGVAVRVKVWPDVLLPHVRVAHHDFFLEHYFMDENGLAYVGHEDPGPQQGFTEF
ncbi:hypothetical protein [Paludisphaera soli]|uniref:hypothetical protein n=1 Tax=Paludisphaera soli TaxID=2712865 RepID=UPI0013EA195F|nr:hypothetical protein [Paludisphaera soli]